MERTVYLERMRKALYHAAHGGIREEDIVTCGGIQYYPYEYILTYDAHANKWQHSAVLHDLKAESIQRVKLEEVDQ